MGVGRGIGAHVIRIIYVFERHGIKASILHRNLSVQRLFQCDSVGANGGEIEVSSSAFHRSHFPIH